LIPHRIFDTITNYRANRIADRLAGFVEPGETILDCGCGSMRIAEMLQERCGARVFGTDVIRLNQTHPNFCLCSGENLAFGDKCFDSVLLIFTLHHMRNPADALKESLRVTRRRLIVLEDVHRSPLDFRILKILDWYGNLLISKEMSFPFNFKTETEWKEIFDGLGTNLIAAESIRPTPWRPSRHRVFVLDKKNTRPPSLISRT